MKKNIAASLILSIVISGFIKADEDGNEQYVMPARQRLFRHAYESLLNKSSRLFGVFQQCCSESDTVSLNAELVPLVDHGFDTSRQSDSPPEYQFESELTLSQIEQLNYLLTEEDYEAALGLVSEKGLGGSDLLHQFIVQYPVLTSKVRQLLIRLIGQFKSQYLHQWQYFNSDSDVHTFLINRITEEKNRLNLLFEGECYTLASNGLDQQLASLLLLCDLRDEEVCHVFSELLIDWAACVQSSRREFIPAAYFLRWTLYIPVIEWLQYAPVELVTVLASLNSPVSGNSVARRGAASVSVCSSTGRVATPPPVYSERQTHEELKTAYLSSWLSVIWEDFGDSSTENAFRLLVEAKNNTDQTPRLNTLQQATTTGCIHPLPYISCIASLIEYQGYNEIRHVYQCYQESTRLVAQDTQWQTLRERLEYQLLGGRCLGDVISCYIGH
ncbi:hypothetical protein ACWJJH_01590 [Endozoicomonadaceae bacterium StTr2]